MDSLGDKGIILQHSNIANFKKWTFEVLEGSLEQVLAIVMKEQLFHAFFICMIDWELQTFEIVKSSLSIDSYYFQIELFVLQ